MKNEIDVSKYFYKLEDVKIKKEKLSYINIMELRQALTIFSYQTSVIKSLLERQNYGEAKEKLEELANEAFFQKIQRLYRFNESQYYNYLKKKEKKKLLDKE